MSTEMRSELSDAKFIDWSNCTYDDSYDVVSLASYLKQLDKQELTGLDVGGGIGVFAKTVIDQCPEKDVSFTVVDPGLSAAEQRVESTNISYELNTFDAFTSEQQYDFIVFRLVLHHLIGKDSQDTLETQRAALVKAKSLLKEGGVLFIVENFYEPMLGEDTTSKIIYRATSSKAIAGLTRRLGANTAGEGVRFRSLQSWTTLFESLGFGVDHVSVHPWWGNDMPAWQRWPLLCKNRYQAIKTLRLPETAN